MDFNNKIEKFNELIANSKNIVFFGGAGVSTESGIPDFRSKDGLYNTLEVKFEKYAPEYLLSRNCMIKKPEVFFEFYRQKMDCRNIKPNITHKILADMEFKNKLAAIVTQNIDGLHQKAGSLVVHEIHGTTQKNKCRKCGKFHGEDYIFDHKELIPRCDECGGIVRPYVVLYGEEPMAMNSAANSIAEADLIIIGGTSLTVYPAANLIPTWGQGAKKVIINKELTDFDSHCEIVFHESIGEVFSKIQY